MIENNAEEYSRMNFRQTVALGLSSLMLSGNLVMPYAIATTMAISNQPELTTSFMNVARHPIFVAMADQNNRLFDKTQYRSDVLETIEPVLDLLDQHPKSPSSAKRSSQQKIAQARAATPLEANFRINPEIPYSSFLDNNLLKDQAAFNTALEVKNEETQKSTQINSVNTTVSEKITTTNSNQPLSKSDENQKDPACFLKTQNPKNTQAVRSQ